jgi:hypothetical protein
MSNRVAIRLTYMLTLAILAITPVFGQELQDIPAHGRHRPLFNGRNFDGFDILLR